MATTQENRNKSIENDAIVNNKAGGGAIPIDRSAPAGSPESLGAESVRDGRPASDSDIVEAIDEETPGEIDPLDTK